MCCIDSKEKNSYEGLESLTGAAERPTFLGGLGADSPQSSSGEVWTPGMVNCLALWLSLAPGARTANDYANEITRWLLTTGVWE